LGLSKFFEIGIPKNVYRKENRQKMEYFGLPSSTANKFNPNFDEVSFYPYITEMNFGIIVPLPTEKQMRDYHLLTDFLKNKYTKSKCYIYKQLEEEVKSQITRLALLSNKDLWTNHVKDNKGSVKLRPNYMEAGDWGTYSIEEMNKSWKNLAMNYKKAELSLINEASIRSANYNEGILKPRRLTNKLGIYINPERM